MKTHDLAKILLESKNLPIALHVFGHTYIFESNKVSHGGVSIGILESCYGDHIIIGSFDKENIDCSNYSITEMLFKEKVEE